MPIQLLGKANIAHQALIKLRSSDAAFVFERVSVHVGSVQALSGVCFHGRQSGPDVPAPTEEAAIRQM